MQSNDNGTNRAERSHDPADVADHPRHHETIGMVNFEPFARIEELESVLRRCRTVLGNMALENETAIFNRWPINHEPLRNDARRLLPVIDAALPEACEHERGVLL